MANPASKLPTADERSKSAKDLIDSPDFKALVKRRWGVSMVLLTTLFVSYYGFILLVAMKKEWVSQKISDAPGTVTTIAIPLGIASIVLAWVLTALYVIWANRAYDPEVERLKGQLKH